MRHPGCVADFADLYTACIRASVGDVTLCWSIVLDQNSLLFIVLRYWVTALFSVGFGSLLVALVVPRLQNRWQQRVFKLEKRKEIAESVILSFAAYITAWRRLRRLAQKSQESGLTELEKERKRVAVNDRNSARDRLIGNLKLARIFFDPNTVIVIDSFIEWDSKLTDTKLDGLPDLNEWRIFEGKILDEIKREIG